ncbi:MAG: hypothetical protein HYR55_12535 [Acidobacteria bacterium]|nr:hypothetical protein [Acidobacteriota bacterium]MBI3657478.1 hypothetical protein [Acidobacteriota bacterium]
MSRFWRLKGCVVFMAFMVAFGQAAVALFQAPEQAAGGPLLGAPYAGSYDGPFVLDSSEGGNDGTITLTFRQDGDVLTGRLAQEISDGSCIRNSGFVVTFDETGFDATATAVDGSGIVTSIRAILIQDFSGDRLEGTFFTSGCSLPIISGRFVLPKLPVSDPLDLSRRYTGGVWYWDLQSRENATLTGALEDGAFTADPVALTSSLGTLTGTGTAQLNPEGDRLENLAIRLTTPLGPITIRGEWAVTSDGNILFGGFQSDPGSAFVLHGSTILRAQ